MPVTTRKTVPPSPLRLRSLALASPDCGMLQTFRAITEGYLMQVAQREMLRAYPDGGTPPAPKRGLIYKALPWVFLPGFRLTPWALRRRLVSRFFVHPAQRWPDRPWELPRA